MKIYKISILIRDREICNLKASSNSTITDILRCAVNNLPNSSKEDVENFLAKAETYPSSRRKLNGLISPINAFDNKYRWGFREEQIVFEEAVE